MTNGQVVVEQFLEALAANTVECFEAVFSEDAGMRMYRWDGVQGYRPRERMIEWLRQEWAAWPDPRLEKLSVLAGDDRAAVEVRIHATDPGSGRYVEHMRAAFLSIDGGRVKFVDLYCAEPIPSARRTGWIAPATLTEQQVNELFESLRFVWDFREWVPPQMRGRISLRESRGGSYDPHPGSNSVSGTRWTPEEADAKIEAAIVEHREHNAGFQWFVGPLDTPADLPQRLERHGFVLAGEQSMMARLGLDHLDIPINPDITVEVLDGSDDDAIEAVLQITATCFNWTSEQVGERRPMMHQQMKDPAIREYEIGYLARLDGKPIAAARLLLRGGLAYLGGASTLPEYRGQKVYSTLLRRRLEDARDQGYHLAAIHAEPMSRRVVARYGFREYAKTLLYAWMPVIDMDVIRSLVPDE